MKFLHYIITAEGEQLETIYANNATPKMSLKASAAANNAYYKIWDKETNKIIEA